MKFEMVVTDGVVRLHLLSALFSIVAQVSSFGTHFVDRNGPFGNLYFWVAQYENGLPNEPFFSVLAAFEIEA